MSVLVGNAKLMEKEGITVPYTTVIGTHVYIAINNKYCGYILIEDEIKSDSLVAVQSLKTCGVQQAIMLTGDSDAVGNCPNTVNFIFSHFCFNGFVYSHCNIT